MNSITAARTRILIVRHGQTFENAKGIHQGRGIGGSLSAQGTMDTTQLANHLSGIQIDALYTSPMSRATETATILAEELHPTRVIIDERIAAKNSGYLSGRRRDLVEHEAARADIPIYLFKTPGGESSVDVQLRHIDLWNEVSKVPGTFVLVGHGAGIACLILHLTNQHFDNFPLYVHGSANRTVVDVDDEGCRIVELNVAPPAG